jgi:hypothetical protein
MTWIPYLILFIPRHAMPGIIQISCHDPSTHCDHGINFAENNTYTECQKFTVTEMNQHFGKTSETHLHAIITAWFSD